MIVYNHWFSQYVVTNIVLTGWGPVKSSHNTNYDLISNKNHYIYQIKAIMSNFATNQNSMNTKKMVVNHWFSQSVLNKNFYDGIGTCKSSQNTSMTKSMTKIGKFTRHISNGGYKVKICHGS